MVLHHDFFQMSELKAAARYWKTKLRENVLQFLGFFRHALTCRSRRTKRRPRSPVGPPWAEAAWPSSRRTWTRSSSLSAGQTGGRGRRPACRRQLRESGRTEFKPLELKYIVQSLVFGIGHLICTDMCYVNYYYHPSSLRDTGLFLQTFNYPFKEP